MDGYNSVYQIKIDQFKSISQEFKIEVAQKYLMKHNWNVKVIFSY